jgi:hypothetical protein
MLREHALPRDTATESDPSMRATAAAAAAQARLVMHGWAGDAEFAAQAPTSAPATGSSPTVAGAPGAIEALHPTSAPVAVRDGSASLSGDVRQQALDVVRRAQERLAELPQELAEVEEAAEWARQAQERAGRALRDAQDFRSPQEPRAVAARRAASIAQAQADEAGDWVAQVGEAITPERAAQRMARELRSFASDAERAVDAIEEQLAPALMRVRNAIDDRNPQGIVLGIGQTRQAIAQVQERLRESRQTLLERDPLVAARWFAQEAATLLAATQPAATPGQTQQRQNDALATLRRSWDRPANQRGAAPHPPWGAGSSITDELNSGLGDSALPGYGDSLRLYFQLLGGPDSAATRQERQP